MNTIKLLNFCFSISNLKKQIYQSFLCNKLQFYYSIKKEYLMQLKYLTPSKFYLIYQCDYLFSQKYRFNFKQKSCYFQLVKFIKLIQQFSSYSKQVLFSKYCFKLNLDEIYNQLISGKKYMKLRRRITLIGFTYILKYS
ncbi:unnamed protein product [Paramecium sonneborni]|uniref:Uncharacterized protein n=1 Tax=Paramecium sonneborni TaxID=65129 RepID=A0A8S1PA06_9CILI|nr:unnamed protein product [Paramecium sonneborni]